jgi:hypothetical protein
MRRVPLLACPAVLRIASQKFFLNGVALLDKPAVARIRQSVSTFENCYIILVPRLCLGTYGCRGSAPNVILYQVAIKHLTMRQMRHGSDKAQIRGTQDPTLTAFGCQ